jgi:hypothetical protein
MRILLLGLMLLPASAVAQVVGQYESTNDHGERIFFRLVRADDMEGKNILIEQMLRPLPDGSLEYRPASQPASARNYDAHMCGPGADVPSADAISVWSTDVVHGLACSRSFDTAEPPRADLFQGR